MRKLEIVEERNIFFDPHKNETAEVTLTVALLTRFPSVGKSTLLSNLAGVYSEVAAYEFTTLTTVPGVIRYKGAKIQLLDLPGIIEGAKDGKGRGKQVIAGESLTFFLLTESKSLYIA
ncbi:unnamed protein product [Nippostrongylus brasiliensis]|uniref:OBG-type G domain-containing protein n=1 Tax=Nippostrongylus brasiliensis TaxID=27835 RepID=A0A0N4YFZ2_NIPBR|nr:unnamed protein product [Nippostrongylus brasiliensis]